MHRLQPEQLVRPQEHTPFLRPTVSVLMQTAVIPMTEPKTITSAMLMPVMVFTSQDLRLFDLYLLSKLFAFVILLDKQHVEHAGQDYQSDDQTDDMNFTLDG